MPATPFTKAALDTATKVLQEAERQEDAIEAQIATFNTAKMEHARAKSKLEFAEVAFENAAQNLIEASHPFRGGNPDVAAKKAGEARLLAYVAYAQAKKAYEAS